MTLHLAAISAKVATGAHAALLVDQAGWHLSEQLVVPGNVSIIPLPAKRPELNPQENISQFMRDNWLSIPRSPATTTCSTTVATTGTLTNPLI